MKIVIDLPDVRHDKLLDADHAMNIAFGAADAIEIEDGRIAVSLDAGGRTFLFHAKQDPGGEGHSLALFDASGTWRTPRADQLADWGRASRFRVEVVDSDSFTTLAEHEFDLAEDAEESPAERALRVLWEKGVRVNRNKHGITLYAWLGEDRGWFDLPLLIGSF